MNIHARNLNAAAAIERLKPVFGDRLSTAQIVREQHGQDLTWHKGMSPDAVVFVRSTEEVQAVVKVCAELKVPVIAYGAGTSLEGHITALHGGITISFRDMNQILEVNASDLDCRVQAGVTRKTLNATKACSSRLILVLMPRSAA
jgi:D-lactate dehydrogenase (cytochrome)